MQRRSQIQRLFLVSAIGAAQLAMASSTDNGVLTVGSTSARSPNPVCPFPDTVSLHGFSSTLGSYIPTALSGGRVVNGVSDLTSRTGLCATNQSALSVSGFTANPGGAWLVSITCNGITRTGATAVYGYASVSGVASWRWYNSTFAFTTGSAVSCSIVHN